jgi:hypothetical protein
MQKTLTVGAPGRGVYSVILTTLYLADAKNTDNWCTRKGSLQRVFPLDDPMVPSSALVVAADSECLSCDVFSLSKTIHFGSIEFITDRFGGLSPSPMGDGSGVAMGTTRGGTPSPLWAMIGDSIEKFHTASDGDGRIDLPSPRRHDTGASTTPATTIP